MFQTGILYEQNYASRAYINVNQGGTSSGKTFSILQVLFTLGMTDPGCVISVVAQDVPNLRRGAYRDAKRIWGDSPELKAWWGRPNETDRIFTCINGSIIEFVSFQDEQDAKGSRRDYLFVNECNGITYEVFRQLMLRTRKKIFLDYNPAVRFWVHDEVIGQDNVRLLISDHRHNPFLSPEEHKKIEAYYHQDFEFFQVYARGKTGKLAGLVYSNWEVVQDMPTHFKNEWYGLDFGFTNDPTALVQVRLSEGKLWLKELIAERGLTNIDISKRMINLGMHTGCDIIADSAEPKSIAELQRMRWRVEGAMKGPDSISAGIDILKRYPLMVTHDSPLLRSELAKYRWANVTDKGTGEKSLINKPVDAFNHTLDAVRYVALNRLETRRVYRGAKAKVTSHYGEN